MMGNSRGEVGRGRERYEKGEKRRGEERREEANAWL